MGVCPLPMTAKTGAIAHNNRALPAMLDSFDSDPIGINEA